MQTAFGLMQNEMNSAKFNHNGIKINISWVIIVTLVKYRALMKSSKFSNISNKYPLFA